MIKKIAILFLLSLNANAHNATSSQFSSNLAAELLHAVSHAHHAYGGLAFVALAAIVYLLTKKRRKLQSTRKNQLIKNSKSLH